MPLKTPSDKVSSGLIRMLIGSCAATALLLAGCGGSSSGSGGGVVVGPPPPPPLPPPPPPSGVFKSEASTAQFLARATYGPTSGDITTLTGTDGSDWFKAEIAKPATLYLPSLLTKAGGLPAGERLPPRSVSDMFFDTAIAGDDQLRQRMVFALSEIVVVSNIGQLSTFSLTTAQYVDVLSANAFGNYRNLLEEVTYTPAMAVWLTYLNNLKGDPVSGRMPDENYARELMQLFTIGLVELNMDGTPKLGADGKPIEIFDNGDITGLAKVFTGLSTQGDDFFNVFEDPTALYKPLEIFPEWHSDLEKKFLGLTIPPNTPGEQSIDMALDEIFNHPNMAPFLSRQLIQRFVTSHPEPAYVERVAMAFEAGTFTLPDGSSVGTGDRGDLAATIAAVLFDANAVRDPADVPASFGKVREPIIRVTNWARAFNETTPDSSDEQILAGLLVMGQHPFRSPSVFNFFRPGFVAPGTQTGDAGLTAPELQITNESSALAYINVMNAFIYDFAPNISGDPDGGVKADYTAEIAMADNGQALIDHLDLLLTGGRLAAEEKTRMLSMMDELPIRAGTEDEDRLYRVLLATTMTMTSPGYLVQR